HALLSPADDLAAGQPLHDSIDQRLVAQPNVRRPLFRQKPFDLLVGERRTQQGSAHRIVAAVRSARLSLEAVPCVQGDANRSAGVTRGRLDPETLERAFPENSSVPHTV